ncbi:MAG: hypothetical protein NT077_02050 [Candidatus Taylorbacteria bacterium]|nr:hypothetical protein [Candidatus Taylorbacteria bacterium]
MCEGAPLSSVESEVDRFELRDCDKMVVAQMVELSHMTFPAPAPKNQKEDGTAFLPSNPSCRAVRHNFFEIADQQIVPAEARKRKQSTIRRSCRRRLGASPHFIQGKFIQDFRRKKSEH